MQAQQLEYTGFWLRVAATLIDGLIIAVITVPLSLSIYGTGYFDDDQSGIVAGPADFLINWVLPGFATILFWIYKQATPGKMFLSMRIVDAVTGNPATAGQYVGRYFAYFLSAIPLCLGFIWLAFDRKKQGWHDKLAGTVVIRRIYSGPEPVKFS